MVGIATIATLMTLTRSMSSDIERTLDECGANMLITPQSDRLAMNYGGISPGGVTFDQREIREADPGKVQHHQEQQECVDHRAESPWGHQGEEPSTYC